MVMMIVIVAGVAISAVVVIVPSAAVSAVVVIIPSVAATTVVIEPSNLGKSNSGCLLLLLLLSDGNSGNWWRDNDNWNWACNDNRLSLLLTLHE
jgi:hypothetical protein